LGQILTNPVQYFQVPSRRPPEYARCRHSEAKRLSITVTGLDKAVTEHKIEEPAKEPDRWKLDPWEEPVDGADLLDDLLEIFERYLILPEHG
jgi:hypothetical protein